MILSARRAFAKFRVRSLEIQLHGQNESLQTVRCEETRLAIFLARRITQRALVKARADYNALLPVGERKTWSEA